MLHQFKKKYDIYFIGITTRYKWIVHIDRKMLQNNQTINMNTIQVVGKSIWISIKKDRVPSRSSHKDYDYPKILLGFPHYHIEV
jgi:hypothetical protein